MDTFKRFVLVSLYYEWSLYNVVFNNLAFEKIPLNVLDKWATVTIYHYALTFKLWNLPHYRAPNYQADLLANLKNVALPGTGIPLSVFCYNYYIALIFIFIGIPFYCFVSAIYTVLLTEFVSMKEFCVYSCMQSCTCTGVGDLINKILHCYMEYLLHPTDWFSLWRLNCSVVALHSHATKSASYGLENKWEFLREGHKRGVPVTPFLTDLSHLVCKHKNVEGVYTLMYMYMYPHVCVFCLAAVGGMGIHFFHNASEGGDWILQPRLYNSHWMGGLLPEHAPLSTMRVITASTWDLQKQPEQRQEQCEVLRPEKDVSVGEGEVEEAASDGSGIDGTSSAGSSKSSHSSSEFEYVRHADTEAGVAAAPTVSQSAPGASASGSASATTPLQAIKALSCVLRLGRENALTDHQAVLFDVSLGEGLIASGTVNHNWYQLGVCTHNAVIHGACYLYWNYVRQGIPAGVWSTLDGLSVRGYSVHRFIEEQAARLPKISLKDVQYTHHPDVDASSPPITGQSIPQLQEALDIVTK